MPDSLLHAYVAGHHLLLTRWERLHASERGEGVISAAIAVLVMAFLGAAMWLAFKGMFQGTTDRTKDQVELIGG